MRGRGRNAPVFADGHEDEKHRGGVPPDEHAKAIRLALPKKDRKKMLARLEEHREATLARLEKQLMGITLPPRIRDGTRTAIPAGNA